MAGLNIDRVMLKTYKKMVFTASFVDVHDEKSCVRKKPASLHPVRLQKVLNRIAPSFLWQAGGGKEQFTIHSVPLLLNQWFQTGVPQDLI